MKREEIEKLPRGVSGLSYVLDDDYLDGVRKREHEAAPGDWRMQGNDVVRWSGVPVAKDCFDGPTQEYIARARADVPKLVRGVEALERVVASQRAEIASLKHDRDRRQATYDQTFANRENLEGWTARGKGLLELVEYVAHYVLNEADERARVVPRPRGDDARAREAEDDLRGAAYGRIGWFAELLGRWVQGEDVAAAETLAERNAEERARRQTARESRRAWLDEEREQFVRLLEAYSELGGSTALIAKREKEAAKTTKKKNR